MTTRTSRQQEQIVEEILKTGNDHQVRRRLQSWHLELVDEAVKDAEASR